MVNGAILAGEDVMYNGRKELLDGALWQCLSSLLVTINMNVTFDEPDTIFCCDKKPGCLH